MIALQYFAKRLVYPFATQDPDQYPNVWYDLEKITAEKYKLEKKVSELKHRIVCHQKLLEESKDAKKRAEKVGFSLQIEIRNLYDGLERQKIVLSNSQQSLRSATNELMELDQKNILLESEILALQKQIPVNINGCHSVELNPMVFEHHLADCTSKVAKIVRTMHKIHKERGTHQILESQWESLYNPWNANAPAIQPDMRFFQSLVTGKLVAYNQNIANISPVIASWIRWISFVLSLKNVDRLKLVNEVKAGIPDIIHEWANNLTIYLVGTVDMEVGQMIFNNIYIDCEALIMLYWMQRILGASMFTSESDSSFEFNSAVHYAGDSAIDLDDDQKPKFVYATTRPGFRGEGLLIKEVVLWG